MLPAATTAGASMLRLSIRAAETLKLRKRHPSKLKTRRSKPYVISIPQASNHNNTLNSKSPPNPNIQAAISRNFLRSLRIRWVPGVDFPDRGTHTAGIPERWGFNIEALIITYIIWGVSNYSYGIVCSFRIAGGGAMVQNVRM